MEINTDINIFRKTFKDKKYLSFSDYIKTISEYDLNRLILYGIILKKDGKYKINSEFDLDNNISISYELEAEALKKTYFYFYNNKKYEEAGIYLNKYISFCDENNIQGHYYYLLEDYNEKQQLLCLSREDRKYLEKLHLRFDKCINRKDFIKALDIAKEYFLVSNGDNLYSYLLLAIAYNRLDMNEEANFYLMESYDIFPNSPTVFSELAKLHIREEKYENAIDDLNELMKLDSINVYSYVLLYKSYYLNGDFDQIDSVINLASNNLSKKRFKFFNQEIEAFRKAIYYRYEERIKYIDKILNLEVPYSNKIKQVINYINSIDDCTINKKILLFDTYNKLNLDSDDILNLSDGDKSKSKKYIKELKKINNKKGD